MRSNRIGGGVSLSAIGLGGFELGPEAGEEPDVKRAVEVVRTSVGAGMDWLDTSENYHEERNEALIGQALSADRLEIKIATKVAPGEGVTGGGSGFRPEQIHSACRGSLARLRRDVIDVYFLHWPDDSGVPLEETWGAMAELVDQGLVRAIGLSNYEIADIARCNSQRHIDVVQTGLSLIDYLGDRELIASCGELGIGVVIYEPLASGILTGKTLQQVRETSKDWVDEPFYKRLLSKDKGERSIAVAEGMRPIADGLGSTVAQVAIAWVLHQPGVIAAIAGSRDGRHVVENAGAADLDLDHELDELEALIKLGPSFV